MFKIKVLGYITFVLLQPKTPKGGGTSCMNQVVERLNSNVVTEVGNKVLDIAENSKFGSQFSLVLKILQRCTLSRIFSA